MLKNLKLKNAQKIVEEERRKLAKRNSGITLIALVITIIVLLILAGISIATLTGENGILTRANDAKVETRGAAVEERKNLWKSEQDLDKRLGTSDAKELNELLDELENENLLIGNERQTIEETGKITIGSRTIEFEETKFAYISGMMDADMEVGIDVRVIVDFEKYYNNLTDNQKLQWMEECVPGAKEAIENKYSIKITTFEDFINYFVQYANEESNENLTREKMITMFKQEVLPYSFTVNVADKYTTRLGNIEPSEWSGTKYYSIYPSAGQYFFRPSTYFSDGNYKITLTDSLGLVNEEISVKYPFDVYGSLKVVDTDQTTYGHPYFIENNNPIYIYNEEGKKLNFSDHFITVEVDGESFEYYDTVNNPLNLQIDGIYVIETNVNGNRAVGFIQLYDLPEQQN